MQKVEYILEDEKIKIVWLRFKVHLHNKNT